MEACVSGSGGVAPEPDVLFAGACADAGDVGAVPAPVATLGVPGPGAAPCKTGARHLAGIAWLDRRPSPRYRLVAVAVAVA